MTERTTVYKLRRYTEMVEAKRNYRSWEVNPNNHPLPTLPDQEYLEGEYLRAVSASSPEIAAEVSELIAWIRELRESSL